MASHDRFLANWSSQARKGVLELLVMATLQEREFYGYELVEHVVLHAGMSVSDGTLYAILARLESEGLLSTRWDTASRGPARKYYSLTHEGKSTLAAMQHEWTTIIDAVSRAGVP